MRQGLGFLPTKYLIILSAMALILGTVYETFVTTYTILKPQPIIFNNMKELIENGYKIYLRTNQKNKSQAAMDKYKDLFSYNGMKQIEDPSLFVHLEYTGTANRHWFTSDIIPSITSKKVSCLIQSQDSFTVLAELELCCGEHTTCFKTKQQIYEPWFSIDLIELLGPSNMYLYWGLEAFQIFGIDMKIVEMSLFRDLLETHKEKSRYAIVKRLDHPRPISLSANVVMIFYIWFMLLGASLLVFFVEIFSIKENQHVVLNLVLLLCLKVVIVFDKIRNCRIFMSAALKNWGTHCVVLCRNNATKIVTWLYYKYSL